MKTTTMLLILLLGYAGGSVVSAIRMSNRITALEARIDQLEEDVADMPVPVSDECFRGEAEDEMIEVAL